METSLKTCKNCLQTSDVTNFYKYLKNNELRRTICKRCSKIVNKDYELTHIESRRKTGAIYQKEHRNQINETRRIRNLKNPIKKLIVGAKRRAKLITVDFSLTESDIIIPPYCPILGIELRQGVGKQIANSPSLDIIDSSKGYVKGNVQVISYKANAMKQNASKEELLKFSDWIQNFYGS